jgi:DNA-binding response OmpR family regulator
MAARILVVDDDDSLRELLRMHLSSAGYEVSTAADAIAAGYLVLRSPP